MSDPFIGELRCFSFGRIPSGWAPCNGQLMGINTNAALFSLLGTQYGGDGINTFALPNLQSRVSIGASNDYAQGSAGGESGHTLSTDEIPSHTHTFMATNLLANTNTPSANVMLAQSSASPLYGNPTSTVAMAASAVSSAGGQAHENRQPYLGVNMCIALVGIYPSRN